MPVAVSADSREQRAQRVEALLQWPLLVATLLVIPSLLLQSQPAGSSLYQLGDALNWTIWLAFLVELVVMLAVSPDRWGYLKTHKLDTFIVLFTPPFGPASLQGARLLRLLRLTRLLRLVTLAQNTFTPQGIKWAAIIATSIVVLGGAAFVQAEPEQHLNLFDGLWWSLSTVTTVGYGDIGPKTDLGRVIGMVVMLTGVGFVALVTAAGAQYFIGATRREEQAEQEELSDLQQLDGRLQRLEDELARITARLDAVLPPAGQRPPGR